MGAVLPWLRIAAVVAVYLAVAAGAAALVRRRGGDLRDVRGRTSHFLLMVGAAANALVLALTLVVLGVWDGRAVSALGLRFDGRDLAFSAAAALVSAGGAAAFVTGLARGRRLGVRARGREVGEGARLAAAAGVLALVAAQEEVLYRGYVTLNLLPFGPGAVLAAGTLIFTAIHFLTNRVTPAQVASWLAGGLLLGCAYLVSGTIWVPILLHLAMDLTNVLVFAITGELSLVALSRPVTVGERAAFRVLSGAATLLLLLAFYGSWLAPRWR